jgi:hypothetical protein
MRNSRTGTFAFNFKEISATRLLEWDVLQKGVWR